MKSKIVGKNIFQNYFFSIKKSPITKQSIFVFRKHLIASLGELTIGWPLILKDVFKITGQLVRLSKQFYVILTDNLFGDILSDVAAMLTGAFGMLTSASLGAINEKGTRAALYEPVHGTAPDIAGQGKANPLAMIMSFAMMLKYSFDMQEDSQMIEKAIQNVLSKGLRTPDIKQGAVKVVSTSEMGQAVIDELTKLIDK